MENVHSALSVVAMPTQDEELDQFLAGSPPQVPDKSSANGVKRKKSKSAPRYDVLRVVQVCDMI